VTRKVLLFSFYFRPDLSPGSFRATALADALRRQGAEVEVITSSPNRYASPKVEASAHETAPGLAIRRLPVSSHSGGMASQVRMYRGFAKPALALAGRAKVDVVAVTTGRMFTATLAAFTARQLRKPLYVDVRDIFVDTIQDVLPRPAFLVLSPLLRVIERYTFGRATLLNLVSPGFVPYFQKRFPMVPFEVRTNGVDDLFLDALASAGPAAPPNGDGPLRIVYAGNVGEGQGLHHILPAAAHALAGEAEFHIYGDGGRIQALRDACEAAHVSNVVINQPIARKELAAVYESADALLVHLNAHPAFLKVLPSKLFEYGATGRPIIAGVDGAAADFIRSELPDAALFAPLDVAALVATVRALPRGGPPPGRAGFLAKYSRATISDDMASSILALAGMPAREDLK
jgi:glycosyltransferase involved in cell wall biosynthesis